MTQPRNHDDTAPEPASIYDLRQIPPAAPVPGNLYDTGAQRTAADRNCLSWWFPHLVECGVPTPATRIVTTEPDLRGDELSHLLDGNTPAGYADFLARLTAAVVEVQSLQPVAPDRTPAVFLRTGHTAGKHNRSDTCRLIAAGDLPRHVGALVMASASAGAFGVPMGVWVVREMLPVSPICAMSRYGRMPLVREIRAFVRGGGVECLHPLEGCRVATVVETPNFVRDRLAAVNRGLRYDPVPGGNVPSPAAPVDGRFTWDELRIPNFAAQLYQQFRLPFLDSEERQQKFRCLGGFLAGKSPVDEWLAGRCRSFARGHKSAEQFDEDGDARGVDLLDLEHRHERWVGDAGGLSLRSKVDAEGAVRIQQTSGIREVELVLFYSHEYTPGVETTVAIVSPTRTVGKVECLHSYWPGSAVRKGLAENFSEDDVTDVVAAVQSINVEDIPEVLAILKHVADGFAGLGWWSVDLIETANGWVVTDMAEGARSWHFDGCPHHPQSSKDAGLGWWRVERHKGVWVVKCLGPSFGGYLTPETVAGKSRRGIVNIPSAAHRFGVRHEAEAAAEVQRRIDREEGGVYARRPGEGE